MVIYPIDFANAYPDSNIVTFTSFSQNQFKSMVKWLVYNAVSGRTKPVFGRDWDDYHAILEKADKENWAYMDKLNEYAKLADKHFSTEQFHDFCAESLSNFEKDAYEFFASEKFDSIIDEAVRRYFKIAHEVPKKTMHYKGIHRYWLSCESDRLGLK
ncbi:MAG: hypothetical protein U0354_00250 [Candidatus Sericytochromatia bacterium]